MNIKGAKILVTGGSLGIGKATAKLLAEKGAKIVITGRDAGRLKTAADEIGAIPLEYDISISELAPAKAAEAVNLLGGIDVLINNAGIGKRQSLEEVTIEAFQSVFSTNVFGLTILTKEIIPFFKKQKSGNIINIASTAGGKGFPGGTIYAASKFALRGMTQCWQAELRKDNIRVMCINPSEVTTAFGNDEGKEFPEQANKLRSVDIAHTIAGALEMDDRGFIPELTVWATNPF